ncbi:hypothetical protein C0J52_08726 [Blattella germanica]|nr:hypothetical protein C0J52_08726 [Blattella germanica]
MFRSKSLLQYKAWIKPLDILKSSKNDISVKHNDQCVSLASTTNSERQHSTSATKCGAGKYSPALTIDTVNPQIRVIENAIKGRLPARAVEIEKELEAGEQKPFTEIMKLNLGDSQAMGQKPITFIRQILALVSYEPLFDNPDIPCDAKERARQFLDTCAGCSIGSYTSSMDWNVDICELETVINKAKEVCNPKAIVIINPGNPTGQVMSRETLQNVIKLSYNHNLLLIADEVYQDNIYEGEFISAKKVMHDLGGPYNKIQLVSLYSISKSYIGECGIRGAYMEFQNIDEETLAVVTKLQDISLCPNTPGQCVLYAATNPPTECEPSYGLFMKEKNDIICSLATKAQIATNKFNQIEGVKCNEVKGALYAFPKLELPQNVIEKAQSMQIEPDEFYALQLLENTGICMVPGSGFGQKEGTYHLRSTILLPTDKFQVMFEKFKKFHEKFLKEYKNADKTDQTSTSSTKYTPVLSIDNINPQVTGIEYAIRGPIPARANQLAKELAAGEKKPFTEVIKLNLGDCHAMDWGIDICELENAISKAKEVCNPKAIVIINPGNPTGQVMSRETVENVVKFSYNHNLMLIADEVYQHNIYEGEFFSAKKVMHDLGDPYNKLQLVSLNSVSKGFAGECGIRGGYMEIENIDEATVAVIEKLFSTSLCPTSVGQCAIFAVMKPPTEYEPSYKLFMKEKNDILSSLATKAKMATEAFNQMTGITCNEIKGAMYAFPKLELPQKAIEKAKSLKMKPDFFYALELLENTGICVVPGSGFGQKEGTYHIRINTIPPPDCIMKTLCKNIRSGLGQKEGTYHLRSTILLPADKFQVMLEKFKKFHEKFLKEYNSTKYTPVLSIDTINPQVTGIEYEIRGPIPARANQLAKELEAGEQKPFTEVIKLNLGDCHAMGQKPITFIREVLALALYKPLSGDLHISRDAQHWGIDICELENAISKAKKVCNPKAIVIINPGNPTGQVMSRETVENVVKFSYNHNLMLIADEVYQHNIYEGEFFSAKKVMHDLGDPYNKLQLVSLNSVSKGFAGECGIRGGYMEIENIDEATVAVIEKLFSTSLCPTSVGQCALFAVMKPPKEYEPSYKLFMKEKNDILSSLATKAKMATEAFNQMTGITCNEIKGAMYAFPKLELPQKAIEKAKSLKMKPDFFYALELLENTGIFVVPGSGFGQKEGTYHIRINTIPPPDVFKTMFERFKVYHENFMQEYK